MKRWQAPCLLPHRAALIIEGREIQVQAWRYLIRGIAGHTVPVLFLDSALPENSPWDQTLTDYLYGGDDHYRLCQEAVLGIGGVAMLHALGYGRMGVYHMNERHSALLTLRLLEEQVADKGLRAVTPEDREAVRSRCVFTTHTPVPAGHDQFPMDMVCRALGDSGERLLLQRPADVGPVFEECLPRLPSGLAYFIS